MRTQSAAAPCRSPPEGGNVLYRSWSCSNFAAKKPATTKSRTPELTSAASSRALVGLGVVGGGGRGGGGGGGEEEGGGGGGGDVGNGRANQTQQFKT